MHPYHGWPFLTDPRYPVLSATAHELLHGCIALVIVAPIVWRSRRRALDAALAFLAGPALDLDHVAAAGSFNARRLEDLAGGRPPTHSLLFAGILGLLALTLTRRATIAWCVFAIVSSHVLFDAAGGSTRWLFPISHPDAIPWLAFPAAVVLLTLVSVWVARVPPALAAPRPQPRPAA